MKYAKNFAAALAIALSATPAAADCNPSDGCYGAVASALWNEWDGRAGVAVGSAVNLSSEWEAEDAALSQCHTQSKGNSCSVVGTFSFGGCGYITSGVDGDSVKWFSGSDESSVYDRCVGQGYSCDWPIGGCTSTSD